LKHSLTLGAASALALAGCIIVVDRPPHGAKAHSKSAQVARASAPAPEHPGEPVGSMPKQGADDASEVVVAVPVKAPSVKASRDALSSALGWIAANQGADGSWSDGGGQLVSGEQPNLPRPHAVGVSALCTLALAQSDAHQAAAERGLAWLRAQQDPDSGLVGSTVSHDFLYGHGIATLALVELLDDSATPAEIESVQGAIDYVLRARNPYAAWRYSVPPTGDNDTSVTGWMLAALDVARQKGLKIDEAALEGGLMWIDEVTDPATGRVGYDSVGSLSSRTPANERFPRDKGEAMTAVGLASRVELSGADARREMLASHARLLKRSLPYWDPAAGTVDMYYWFHGTRGMHALGGSDWEVWRASLLRAAVQGQSVSSEPGSWDPVGPWGYSGGRAYATALMALSVAECLE